MPERYGMFDGTPEDPREYSMEDFSRFFTMFLTSGIFNGGTNLKVTCDGTNINTKIGLGRGWIQGYGYEVYESPVVLQHELPNPTLDRIDRVILRLDKTLEHRYLKSFLLKGIEDEKPVPPQLTRNDNVWEISLAQVQIIKGKSYIEPWQIMDERLNNDVCGLVNSLIQADTKTIFDQFQHWYNAKTKKYAEDWDTWFTNKSTEFLKQLSTWYETNTTALEKEFNIWFTTIKQQLDGDIGARLTAKTIALEKGIKSNKEDVTNLAEEIQAQFSDVENVQKTLEQSIKDIDVPVKSVNGRIGAIELTAEEIKTKNGQTVEAQLSETTKEIENLKSSVVNGKDNLYSAIIGKKVTPRSKDFADLTQGIKDIKLGQGNAQVSDVLQGTTFTNDSGIMQNGSMPNNGAKIITPCTFAQAISKGYHDGLGYIKGDINLKPENIKKNVNIFNIIGTLQEGAKIATGNKRYSSHEDLRFNIRGLSFRPKFILFRCRLDYDGYIRVLSMYSESYFTDDYANVNNKIYYENFESRTVASPMVIYDDGFDCTIFSDIDSNSNWYGYWIAIG